MAPRSGLPKRQPGGYHVTDIILEVTAGKQIVDQINREVTLPRPPTDKLNEMGLSRFLASLMPLAAQALHILQTREGTRARTQYKDLPYERIEIRVLSNGRVLGRINGARQTFDLRGQMISPGL